jgi:hypothetical protein
MTKGGSKTLRDFAVLGVNPMFKESHVRPNRVHQNPSQKPLEFLEPCLNSFSTAATIRLYQRKKVSATALRPGMTPTVTASNGIASRVDM